MRRRQEADAIKALLTDGQRHGTRLGLIKDVKAKTGYVRVEIQPEEAMTDWIRYVGLGLSLGSWVASAPPAKEMEVLLLATDVDSGGYVAIGGLFNEVDAPPTEAAEKTILLKHPVSGNLLLLDDDGTIYLGAKTSAKACVLESFLTGEFNDLVSKFNSHTHPETGGTTLPPTSPATPWSSGHTSTKFKGV